MTGVITRADDVRWGVGAGVFGVAAETGALLIACCAWTDASDGLLASVTCHGEVVKGDPNAVTDAEALKGVVVLATPDAGAGRPLDEGVFVGVARGPGRV